MKSLQVVSGDSPEPGRSLVSSLHHPVGVETETKDPWTSGQNGQGDLFEVRKVAMTLDLPFDVSLGWLTVIPQEGGRISAMQRCRGFWRVTAELTDQLASDLSRYHTKPKTT